MLLKDRSSQVPPLGNQIGIAPKQAQLQRDRHSCFLYAKFQIPGWMGVGVWEGSALHTNNKWLSDKAVLPCSFVLRISPNQALYAGTKMSHTQYSSEDVSGRVSLCVGGKCSSNAVKQTRACAQGTQMGIFTPSVNSFRSQIGIANTWLLLISTQVVRDSDFLLSTSIST